jgi:hypothetical protein
VTIVIIHYDKDGAETIISDEPVTVLSIDERCQSDRVYRRQVETLGYEFVATLVGDSMIGHRHDGSSTQARAEAIVNGGKPALEIVK